MKTVNFDKNALKIIADLSKIVRTKDGNAPIKIIKDDEGIHVKAGNAAKTVVFTLDAPSTAFDFEGTEICFYNYNEFYDYFNLFDAATISQGIINEGESDEAEAIVLTQGRRKINYPVSDPEVIKGALKKVNWADPDTVFDYSVENLIQIKKVLGLLGDKNNNVTFTFDGDEVSIKAFTNMNNNSFEDTYAISDPISEKFGITISDEAFKYLLNVNYRVEVKKEGLMRFFFESHNIVASIIVTAVDEESN